MRTLLLILFPFFATAQNTNAAVSDSIDNALSLLGYDTLIQPMQSFYTTGGDLYFYVAQMPGALFRASSHALEPNVFDFRDDELTRAWHVLEIDNWLTGATGTNYEGYTCSGIGTRTCTITITEDTWSGSASNDTNALGLAFYHFLIDPDFATYLQ